MAVGFRIYTRMNRPDPKLVEAFRDISVCNIADSMQKITGTAADIKPFNGVKLLGTAFTVKVPMGDNLMFHQALDMAQAGDVIVVDGHGFTERAICGENMMLIARKRGIAGFLIDGAIRDSAAVEEYDDFSVFAICAQSVASYKGLGPGEIGIAVSIGGMVVEPGDIVVGDEDGVVAVHPADAPKVLEMARALSAKEKDTVKQIEDGTFDHSWVMDTLKAKQCEFIDAAWNE